jgi:hypothetical protein
MAKSSYTKKVGAKPTLPFILVFLGGLFAMMGAFLLPTIGVGLGSLQLLTNLRSIFILSIIASLVVLVCAAAIRYAPLRMGMHMWCALAIIFSVMGLANASASVIMTVGFVLSFAGGILGMVY